MRYVPFWSAIFIERFWVLLVMVFAVLYPLMAYNFGAETFHRNLVYANYYDELIKIENQLSLPMLSTESFVDLDNRLAQIESALRDDEVIRMDSKKAHFRVLLDVGKVRTKIDGLKTAGAAK